MKLDWTDWCMIGLMVLLIIGFIVVIIFGSSSGGSGSGSTCFFMYSGSVATPVCT